LTDPLVSFLEPIRLLWRYLLGYVADFGHRPEKAVQWVLLTVLCAVIIFWIFLGACGFKVEKADKIRPFGAIFFFDRLIPSYRLQEDNYKIETVMVRASRASADSIEQTKKEFNGVLPRVKFLWLNPEVAKATSQQERFANMWIEAIRILG